MFIFIIFYINLQEKDSSLPVTSNLVSFTHAIFTIITSLYIILNDEFILDNYDYEKTLIIYISASYFIYDCLLILVTKFSIMFFYII